ncbi:MAG: hypothetical protein KDB86_09545 [Actinobacteria bacterium]|nr:hypothetical protein [Actinomycetota bacterium]MCB9390318.1 hypothetical protein [Acidimicrobiia bacterium]
MIQLIDDRLLGAVLLGEPPPQPDAEVFTTGYWYVRLCQAVLNASDRPGALSGPFLDLPESTRQRAVGALLQLPDDIGLVSLRDLAPTTASLRARHRLNILSIEAVAAATHLQACVYLSTTSPRLEAALESEGCQYVVV